MHVIINLHFDKNYQFKENIKQSNNLLLNANIIKTVRLYVLKNRDRQDT